MENNVERNKFSGCALILAIFGDLFRLSGYSAHPRRRGLPPPCLLATGRKAERNQVAGGLGFEPRLAESESAVLPLDDPPSDSRLGSGPIARRIDSTTRRRTVGLRITVVPGTYVRFLRFGFVVRLRYDN